jgi:molybdopterin-binding protein
MSTLNGLKLVISKKQLHASPIVIRRNKLISKLHEQLELCEAKREGKTYAPIRLKTFVNKATGERLTTEVPKRVKEWFWVSNENKINLSVKYGAKTLTLNKKSKANAIELASGDELIATIKALKVAVANGELDDAIAEVSEETRMAFGK